MKNPDPTWNWQRSLVLAVAIVLVMSPLYYLFNRKTEVVTSAPGETGNVQVTKISDGHIEIRLVQICLKGREYLASSHGGLVAMGTCPTP